MSKIFPKNWEHKKFEEKLYADWEEQGFFKPKSASRQSSVAGGSNNELRITDNESGTTNKKSIDDQRQTANDQRFVISMPPPNVTGRLHIGHALFISIEDLMTRYHRLKGDVTLWLPGTDHAGIATQTVVDKMLKKQGINRYDLGREKFVDEVWKWKEEYGQIITNQLRRVGASCDWSRERFTLDKGLSEAVNEAFVRLYNKGLIYRGEYLVNWCPRCGTAIADDEVEHREEKAKLYYFKYDKNFPIVIATTRPETKFGDVAVAVNPQDQRYQKYIDQEYKVNFAGIKRKIKVIADRSVDRKFGTGAVGVTPAHSAVDWKLAEDHKLPKIKVIDEQGRMVGDLGDYAGLKTKIAREKLIQYLSDEKLIEKVEEVDHNLSVCYRCDTPIEPLPSLQWFVRMKPLAEKAKEAVKSGKIEIIPKRFEKVYFHWMDNIRDWCISRQLWWGHRIPVWYRQDANLKFKTQNLKFNENSQIHLDCHSGLDPESIQMDSRHSTVVHGLSKIEDLRGNDKMEIYVGTEPPEGEGWVRDEDVLDTWFSSGLWPFSTLGWPHAAEASRGKSKEEISDYEYFYPTTVMETGYDILFFWVARMIMMGLELTGKPPFKTVYLHGLVRDEQNRKMSKSLGNVLDPLDIIDKYGADALRMSLLVGSTPGQDLALGESKIKGYRNFSNKIWNASRFVTLRVSEGDLREGTIGEYKIENIEYSEKLLTKTDKEILNKHKEIKIKVKKYLDEFKFSLAGETLYDYFWHDFCDSYIESTKDQLLIGSAEFSGDSHKLISKLSLHPTLPENTKKILAKILSETLIMLHPFVPFVTEAVWQELREVCPKLSESIIVASWPE
jgi:valyl-tRNA synthetase